MKAAWYEKQGPARNVLVVGEMPDPIPAAGEARNNLVLFGREFDTNHEMGRLRHGAG
jgi:hypothetical protein